VTANLAITGHRRDGNLWRRVQLFLGRDDEALARTPGELFEAKETARDCERAIEGLPPRQRVVLWMKLLDGRSQREISQALDLSEGQVSKLVTQGLTALRKKGFGTGDE
jgi:RNA polymerase sigma factor (sigma-70 family)